MRRHCEPTGRANARPMTGSAKQSIFPRKQSMDCFVALLLAMLGRLSPPRHLQHWPARGRIDVLAGMDKSVALVEADGAGIVLVDEQGHAARRPSLRLVHQRLR